MTTTCTPRVASTCHTTHLRASTPSAATTVHGTVRYIVAEGKGNIYYPGLASDIRVIAESYLVCRRKGMPEPSHQDLHIRFHFKMVEEWKTRRAAEGALPTSAPTAGIACGLGASGEGVSVRAWVCL